MKSVLISNRPKWCGKICHEIGKDENGKPIYEKRIEVRKTAPKEVPFKAYIYCTQGDDLWLNLGASISLKSEAPWAVRVNKKVIGEFICDKVYNLVNAFGGIMFADENLNQLEPQLFRDMSCLTDWQTADYLGGKDGYGLHIADLKIYGKPKELSEFRKSGFMTEEEWLFNLYPNTHCHYEAWAKKFEITRPPQSWMYVEEIETR